MMMISDTLSARAHQIWSTADRAVTGRTDRLLGGLLFVEWLAGLAVATWYSPTAWAGLQSSLHPNVLSALLLGGVVALPAAALAFTRPASVLTRHAAVASQMLMTALLIHLAGGRSEAHFLVFVSIAFFSFYRDWRVFVTATAVIAVDHLLRSFLAPASVFGAAQPVPWRAIEHACWVLFEDGVVVAMCVGAQREMRISASNLADIELRDSEARSMVEQAQSAIGTIQRTSRQFSSESDALSRRSGEQSAELRQSAERAAELATSARQTASNTSAAHGDAATMETLARQSSTSAAAVMECMREAGAASARIGEFGHVIDHLAFQINILSLNASIEAARAGEHGRGFAVVAQEVRSLAEKSAQASRDIRGLVEVSTEKATQGVSLAEGTNTAISSMLTSSQRVTAVLATIAETSAEQSTAVDQIARALQALDETTKENAEQATASAAAATTLDADATSLADALSTFTSDGGQAVNDDDLVAEEAA